MRSLAPIAGVELNDTLACDSRNFCDTWLGRSGEPRDYILSMAYNREVSLRTPRWKYIPAMKGPAMVPWGPKIETGFASEAQLYDLSFKKGENKNVIESQPQVAKELDLILRHQLATPYFRRRAKH